MKRDSMINAIRSGIDLLGRVSPHLAGRVALEVFSRPKRYDRPEWERKLLASAKPFQLRSGMKAYRWGEGGPRVLLVHGWEGRGSQLATLAEPLVREGFEVIAHDGPAHGDSPGKKTNIHFFSNAITDASEELEGLHAVVAHSFGAGATILSLARGLRATRVVLVASPSNLQRVIDNYIKFMKLTPPVAHSMQRQLEKWAGIAIKELQIEPVLERHAVPALIVHDPEDREVAYQNAEFFAKNWPGARLLTLQKVGHRRILRDSLYVEGVTRFLKEGPQIEEVSEDSLVAVGSDQINR